jgi:MFS family permease
MLAQHFGHKNVWLSCLTGAAVMNMLVPIASSVGGLNGAMAARFLFGVCQGPLFPIQTGILAAWLHEKERSTLNACVGLCWALFQGVQSTLTPYFMNGIYMYCSFGAPLWVNCAPMTGPGWQWAFVFYSILVFMWAHYWNKVSTNSASVEPPC